MDNNYHKVPISVNLLLIKNNALLLGLRNKVKQDQGLWGFVAGHLEEGESIISAMIREAKEELGIKIKNSDLKLVSVIHGLKPAYVGENNYRYYDDEVIQKLILIKEAKSVGFTLSEIQEIIDAWYSKQISKEDKIQILDRKLLQINEKIKELNSVKKQINFLKSEVEEKDC